MCMEQKMPSLQTRCMHFQKSENCAKRKCIGLLQEKKRTKGSNVAVRVYQMKRKVIAIGTVLQSVWPVGWDESKINLVFKDGLRQLTLIACPNRMDTEIYQ